MSGAKRVFTTDEAEKLLPTVDILLQKLVDTSVKQKLLEEQANEILDEVLEEGTHYLLKKIIVNSGGKLSLQSHQHRSEHWIIAEGEAEVTINNEIKILKENETIFIPKGSKHRLANELAKKLIIIELWYGDILDENDIERFEDIYERI